MKVLRFLLMTMIKGVGRLAFGVWYLGLMHEGWIHDGR
jgi:hypothetical protein